MENPFSDQSEISNIISKWLNLKMKNQFNTELNLQDSYVIEITDSVNVITTDETTSLNYGQKSHLATFCRKISSGEISLQQMKAEIKE